MLRDKNQNICSTEKILSSGVCPNFSSLIQICYHHLSSGVNLWWHFSHHFNILNVLTNRRMKDILLNCYARICKCLLYHLYVPVARTVVYQHCAVDVNVFLQGFCCPCDANSTLLGERCVYPHAAGPLVSSVHCLTFDPLWCVTYMLIAVMVYP